MANAPRGLSNFLPSLGRRSESSRRQPAGNQPAGNQPAGNQPMVAGPSPYQEPNHANFQTQPRWDASARIAKTATVTGAARIRETAAVLDGATVTEHAQLTEMAQVYGDVRVAGSAVLGGAADVSRQSDFVEFGTIGNLENLTLHRSYPGPGAKTWGAEFSANGDTTYSVDHVESMMRVAGTANKFAFDRMMAQARPQLDSWRREAVTQADHSRWADVIDNHRDFLAERTAAYERTFGDVGNDYAVRNPSNMHIAPQQGEPYPASRTLTERDAQNQFGSAAAAQWDSIRGVTDAQPAAPAARWDPEKGVTSEPAASSDATFDPASRTLSAQDAAAMFGPAADAGWDGKLVQGPEENPLAVPDMASTKPRLASAQPTLPRQAGPAGRSSSLGDNVHRQPSTGLKARAAAAKSFDDVRLDAQAESGDPELG